MIRKPLTIITINNDPTRSVLNSLFRTPSYEPVGADVPRKPVKAPNKKQASYEAKQIKIARSRSKRLKSKGWTW